MNTEKFKSFKVVLGILFLIIALAVSIVFIRERQTTKNEASEIPVPLKQITCTWIDNGGNYTVRLVDASGNIVQEQAAPSGTSSLTFSNLDPRSLPDPVYCEIADPLNLSCKKRSAPIVCLPPPTETPSPTPLLPGECQPCQEDEVLPRCAAGLQCVYYADGTKFCENPEGQACGPTPTLTPTPTRLPLPPTSTPTLTLTPTPLLSPTATPTNIPGQPTNTPVPPTSTPTRAPLPTATPTTVSVPTPTTCPIPPAVTDLALACTVSSAQLTWTASEGADYYLVTIKDENTGLPIDGFNPNKKIVGATKATFTAITGHSYTAFVEAVHEQCGGSSARQSNACSYSVPTNTPAPTDIVIANVTKAPTASPTKSLVTAKPTLPQTGLSRNSLTIAVIFAAFGIGAVLAGLLIKI